MLVGSREQALMEVMFRVVMIVMVVMMVRY